MENSILPLIFVLIFLSLQDRKVFAEKIKDEVAIKQFLRTVNEQGTKLCISSKAKFWEFQNNLNSQEAKSSAVCEIINISRCIRRLRTWTTLSCLRKEDYMEVQSCSFLV